jgi:hypothetical protein
LADGDARPSGGGVGGLDVGLDGARDDDLDAVLTGTSKRTAGRTLMQLSSERIDMPTCTAA